MICKYSVTFEFDNDKPITENGEVKGGGARTIAARAIDEAIKKRPKTMWSSMVVFIERKK